MKIFIENPVWCRGGPDSIGLIKRCLSFEATYWRQGPFGKMRKTYVANMVVGQYHFLAGFRQRINEYALHNNTQIEWAETNRQEKLLPIPPHLPNIILRKDQLTMISQANSHQRGMLQAPPGLGKTVLAMGIISCYPGKKTLFLVNEQTLMEQTLKSMAEQGFHTAKYGAGCKDLGGNVVVGMVQSVVRADLKIVGDLFDIIIVDEADVGMGANSQLYRILTSSLVPIRIGLSATLPQKQEQRLFLEGLLGPVIGEITIQDGVKADLLSKPKLRLLLGCSASETTDLYGYANVYNRGIVNNRSRNRRIIMEAISHVEAGRSCLILTASDVEHGKNIAHMASDLGYNAPFIWGSVPSEDRNNLRQKLHHKQQKLIIANKVWTRGINIPTLDVIIIATGNKSDASTKQIIGRGLRKADGKEEILIVDFLDGGRYLAEHTIQRLTLYKNEGIL